MDSLLRLQTRRVVEAGQVEETEIVFDLGAVKGGVLLDFFGREFAGDGQHVKALVGKKRRLFEDLVFQFDRHLFFESSNANCCAELGDLLDCTPLVKMTELVWSCFL